MNSRGGCQLHAAEHAHDGIADLTADLGLAADDNDGFRNLATHLGRAADDDNRFFRFSGFDLDVLPEDDER